MTNVFRKIIGQEIDDVFWALANQVTYLSSIYQDYHYLFGEGSETRVAMLNKAGSSFFSRVQTALEHELMLGLCRATDPTRTVSKENLTVIRLEPMLKKKSAALGLLVSVRAKRAEKATKFARDWRNRVLSHNDVELSIGLSSARPLSAATLGKIDHALTTLDEVLKAVLAAYGLDESNFREFTQWGGPFQLLAVVDEGLRAREQRMARIVAGQETDDD